MSGRFRDRRDAGRTLAAQLARYANRPDVVVLALPRGGVPVGFEVARGLDAPLDIFLVRKLGLPGRQELAMGAVASGGTRVLNEPIVATAHISPEQVDAVTAREQHELSRQEARYRGDRPPLDIQGRTIVLVDDGLATGATMRAAAGALRRAGAARVIVAVPVAAEETCDALRPDVDEIICALTPKPFFAVSQGYEDFSETTDQEVIALIGRAAHRAA